MPGKNKSKRGKKNMRKNTDISDIEAAIDEAREQRKRFGGLINEMSQDELFFTDKSGQDSKTAKQKARKEKKKPYYLKRLDEAQRYIEPLKGTKTALRLQAKENKKDQRKERKRQAKVNKIIRQLKLLKKQNGKEQESDDEEKDAEYAKYIEKYSRYDDSDTESEDDSLTAHQSRMLTKKEWAARRKFKPAGPGFKQRSNHVQSKQKYNTYNRKNRPEAFEDHHGLGFSDDEDDDRVDQYTTEHISTISSAQEKLIQAQLENDALWNRVPDVKPNRLIRTLKEDRKKGLNNNPMVQLPHPGASYNPDREYHQSFMAKEVAKDMEAEERKEWLSRKLHPQLDSDDEQELHEKDITGQWLGLRTDVDPARGSEDEYIYGDDSDNESDSSDGSWNLVPSTQQEKEQPVKGVRKTTAQRNKEARLKAAEEARLAEKKRKRQEREIFEFKKHKKELVKLEQDRQRKKRRKEELAEQFSSKPKRLGKYKYRERKEDVLTTDELPDHLRTLTAVGDLFQERLDSLEKRNMLEPRKRVKKRGPKYPKIEYDRRAIGEKAREMQEAANERKELEKKKRREEKKRKKVEMKDKEEEELVW
eukprot:TRINITY_DN6690_c0_g1_i1.p1 TRINITY_DN6690_c0_g1~~TRINITY_DN6690_c0_g1_i1.p1  ORF type:complete len:599 (+),score=232.71 TRINITY_DN6690_c0_g1_i1:28-1797(+)